MAPQLTSDQLKIVGASVAKPLRYLNSLQQRMVDRGFVEDDELLAATRKAFDAVYALSVKLHYAGCEAFKRERENQQLPPGLGRNRPR